MLYELLFLLWVEALLVEIFGVHWGLNAFASSGQCVSVHVVFFSNLCILELLSFTLRFHRSNCQLHWVHIVEMSCVEVGDTLVF